MDRPITHFLHACETKSLLLNTLMTYLRLPYKFISFKIAKSHGYILVNQVWIYRLMGQGWLENSLSHVSTFPV